MEINDYTTEQKEVIDAAIAKVKEEAKEQLGDFVNFIEYDIVLDKDFKAGFYVNLKIQGQNLIMSEPEWKQIFGGIANRQGSEALTEQEKWIMTAKTADALRGAVANALDKMTQLDITTRVKMASQGETPEAKTITLHGKEKIIIHLNECPEEVIFAHRDTIAELEKAWGENKDDKKE